MSLKHSIKIQNFKLPACRSLSVGRKISLGIVLSASFFVFMPSADASVITRAPNNLGLVGYWSFDEGRGDTATDLSGYQNNANLEGGFDWVSGRVGGAVDFGGTGNYGLVDTTSGDVLDISDDITLSVWVTWNSFPGNYNYIISKNLSGGYADQQWGMVGRSSGDLEFVWNGSARLAVGLTWEENRWYHLVATKDGSSITLYRDGEEVGTATHDSTPDFKRWLNFGRRSDSSDGTAGTLFWDGMVDEVRIYNRGLSASEVEGLYENSRGVVLGATPRSVTNGLVGHWTFDGPHLTNTTAIDVAGSNDGTRNGTVARPGRIGQALEFDGVSDYILIDSNSLIPTNDDFTIAFWADTNVTPNGDHRVAIGTGPTSGERNYIYTTTTFGAANNQLRVWFGAEMLVGSDLRGAGWKHIVVKREGDNWTLYEDADVIDTATVSGSIPSHSETEIGGGSVDNRFHSGSLDDVRIYNRALSESEIGNIYTATKPSPLNVSPTGALTDGLVGHWTFAGPDVDGTTVYDVTGNEGDVSIANNARPAIGIMGQGFSFNGNTSDHLHANDPSEALVVGTDDWSVATWIKTSGYHGSNNHSGVITSGASSNSTPGWAFLLLDNNRLRFRLYMGDEENHISQNSASISGGFANNEWRHIGVTVKRDGDLIFYLDGEVVSSHDFSALNNFDIPAGTSLRIARWAGWYFNGDMDDVRVYNRVLSADEITRLYNMGR